MNDMFDRNPVSNNSFANMSQNDVKKILKTTPLVAKAATVATVTATPKGLADSIGYGVVRNSNLTCAPIAVAPLNVSGTKVQYNGKTSRFVATNPYASTTTGIATMDGIFVSSWLTASPLVKGNVFGLANDGAVVSSAAYVGYADLVAWAYQKFTG